MLFFLLFLLGNANDCNTALSDEIFWDFFELCIKPREFESLELISTFKRIVQTGTMVIRKLPYQDPC